MRRYFGAFLLWAVIVSTAFAANPNKAFLIGTDLQTSSASGYVIVSGNALAQEIVFTEDVKTSSITIVVGGSYKNLEGGAAGFGADVAFLVQLTKGLGSGSTILAQQELVFKALPDRYYASTFSVPAHLKLDEGTYYLVLSTKSTSAVGDLAWSNNEELDSSVGHLGIAYYGNPYGYEHPNEATFVPATIGDQVLQFQLFGRAVR
jgi:hypothetical protein